MHLARYFLILSSALALTITGARGSGGDVISGVDLTSLDQSYPPCKDFYGYANGGWLKKNPVPADYPGWGRFNEVEQRTRAKIRQILEDASASNSAPAGSIERKVGDFYSSCMSEERIESDGLKPLMEELARIEKIKTSLDLRNEIAHLHSMSVNALFLVGSKQDARNSSEFILEIWQGGLGLPEGEYYFKDDDKTKQIRAEYVKHVARMFELMGDDASSAGASAKSVIDFETKLAESWMPRTKRRDPKEVYNRKTLVEMKAFAPNFSWTDYLKALGLKEQTDINVGQPLFFEKVNQLLGSAPLADWKTYLRWRLINDFASALSSKFVAEDFNFKGKVLTGATENQPRWKRCVGATESAMNEAVGQLFVKKSFPPEAKRRAVEMVKNLEAALRSDLQTLDWMSQPTRTAAIAKLDAFVDKIGYPDRWRDYSALRIDRRSFITNRMRANAFEIQRDLSKVGKALDRSEWVLAPQAVDAGYVMAMNEIVFPAGILQPPIFDPTVDDAFNYGAMGAVIGHEMTHGFDDQGRHYDASGNLTDWWSPKDAENFKERAACIISQFDQFEVEPGLNVSGKLVVGESIADLGGLNLAYAAWRKSLEGRTRPPVIDGFTPEQRFFLGWAQMWAENVRPEFARLQVNTNTHPLSRFRVNGPLANMPEFAAAFSCKEGDAMMRTERERCRIW